MARGKTFGPHRYEFEIGKRTYDLEADIDDIIAKVDSRLLAVTQSSLIDMIEQAQVPVAQGGKMRVKTGFLRASGIAAINNEPTRPDTVRDPQASYAYNGKSIAAVVMTLKMGDVFHFGWVANYARIREAYDGFLESAMMNWQTIVDKRVNEFRERLK